MSEAAAIQFGIANMAKHSIDIDPDLVDLIELSIISKIKYNDVRDQKLRADALLNSGEFIVLAKSLVSRCGYLGFEGFMLDIIDERKEFERAAFNLRKKIRQVGVLFLDVDGSFREKPRLDWPNPSADA